MMEAKDLIGMEGRRALVEGVLVSGNPFADGDVTVDILCADGPITRWIAPSAIREILPQELKRGDRVRAGGGTASTALRVLVWREHGAPDRLTTPEATP